MSMTTIKIISILLIAIVAAIGGAIPFSKNNRAKVNDFPLGQALASGVFLGAGLIHMLGDAADGFSQAGAQYPWAFFIAGAIILVFLFLEHLGREVFEHEGGDSGHFAIMAFIMLSVHSFLVGAALGFSSHTSVVLLLLIAVLAHKWAASFALAVQITKSAISKSLGMVLFILFVSMTPLGIILGSVLENGIHLPGIFEPMFNAIAAGTFIYLGTLHGLSRAFMIEKCCNLKNFSFVIVGFALMAVVAIWM